MFLPYHSSLGHRTPCHPARAPRYLHRGMPPHSARCYPPRWPLHPAPPTRRPYLSPGRRNGPMGCMEQNWDLSRKSHGGEPPGTMKNDPPMIFCSAWSNPRLALDGFVEIKTRSKGLKPSFPDSVAILEVHPRFRQIHILLAYWSNILILHIWDTP